MKNEKEHNEAKWKTKGGFDNVMKRLNWNEHPKRPAQSTIEGLKNPYHLQAQETKDAMKGFAFVPGENGKPDFQSKVKAQGNTFSNADYFKTVFISGDDMVAEELKMKQKLIDDFNKKVIVDSKNFIVNTREKQKVSQLDRFKNIRENEVKKVGLRHKNSRITALAGRQIMATRIVEDAPVSMLKEEEYVRMGYRAPFKNFDPVKSITEKDMDCNVNMNTRLKSPLSRKTFIKPISADEKSGPRWG